MRISWPASKLFASGVARELIPVKLGTAQSTTHQCLVDAARLQFLLDTSRAITTCGPRTDVNLGVTIVLLQALVSQVVEGIGNIVRFKSFGAELAFKLAAAVFASRERADRQVARPASCLLAQASSNASRSSSTALATAALEVIATARMLASISAATLGLSFKY